MREGHHHQANGPRLRQSTNLALRKLGPLAEFYAMRGWRLSGLEITLSGVKSPQPENPAVDSANNPANRRRASQPMARLVETPLAGKFAGHRSRSPVAGLAPRLPPKSE